MAAEEQRIQRIVRQIVSSQFGGATPSSTNVQLSSSSTVLPMNVVGGYQHAGEELCSRFQFRFLVVLVKNGVSILVIVVRKIGYGFAL